jgi:hypothetical protein
MTETSLSPTEKNQQPTSNQGQGPSLPSTNLQQLQARISSLSSGLNQSTVKLCLSAITLDLPEIPVPKGLQKNDIDTHSVINQPQTFTQTQLQQLQNSIVQLSIPSQDINRPINSSGAIVGIKDDRKTILVATSLHPVLEYMDVVPKPNQSTDLISQGKEKARKLLGQNLKGVTIPMNGVNVRNVKFAKVPDSNGSEQILLEIDLNEPLNQNFQPLTVADGTKLADGQLIGTAGYGRQQPKASIQYLVSDQGRIADAKPTTLTASETTKDETSDDKVYNNLILGTNTTGVFPGTSGGAVVAIDGQGKLTHIGTISAKDKDQTSWISANDPGLFGFINSWNQK